MTTPNCSDCPPHVWKSTGQVVMGQPVVSEKKAQPFPVMVFVCRDCKIKGGGVFNGKTWQIREAA